MTERIARKARQPGSGVEHLLRLIDESFQRKSWHGTNLRGSIRGLPADIARWRAPGAKHSIAEIVVHCAYWKYTVRRRLRGEKRGSFVLKGSNWFKIVEPLTEPAWREHVALLEEEHRTLREAIAALTPAEAEGTLPGSKLDRLALIHGIAFHDIYHAGQIQVLKAMAKRIP
jgi:hypothetical protein